jgi:hypothetical protein
MNLGFASPCIIILSTDSTNLATSQVYYLVIACAVGRGRTGSARPRPTALPSPTSDRKSEAVTAVVVAPDDGHEDAQNMLSCI